MRQPVARIPSFLCRQIEQAVRILLRIPCQHGDDHRDADRTAAGSRNGFLLSVDQTDRLWVIRLPKAHGGQAGSLSAPSNRFVIGAQKDAIRRGRFLRLRTSGRLPGCRGFFRQRRRRNGYFLRIDRHDRRAFVPLRFAHGECAVRPGKSHRADEHAAYPSHETALHLSLASFARSFGHCGICHAASASGASAAVRLRDPSYGTSHSHPLIAPADALRFASLMPKCATGE